MLHSIMQSRLSKTGLFLFIALFSWALCRAEPVFSNDVIRIFADTQHVSYASSVAEQLTDKIYSLHREIGIYPELSADFIIVPSRPAYQALTKHKAVIVEHSDAFYSPKDRAVYIRSPEQISDNYLKILMHEYIHWYVDYIFGRAPLWFHEGMAVQYSHQLGYDRYYRFVRSTFWGEKIHLNQMYHRYPQEKKDWDLFYVTSAFVIKYVRDDQPEAWKRFWDFAARHPGASFSNTFYNSYGATANSFANGFESYARRIGWQYLFLGINGFIFAMMPFLLIITHYKRRRRQRMLPDLALEISPEEGDDSDKSIDRETEDGSIEKDEVNLEK